MAQQYKCALSQTGTCEHGGNKAFNYGFMRGTAQYCRHSKGKKFTDDLSECPKSKESPEIFEGTKSALDQINIRG